jgi:uncharacterized protein
MNCPVDGTMLVMTDRSGVEIDYCPQCRGVWLDRGELDKIIDRTETGNGGRGNQYRDDRYRDDDRRSDDDDRDDDDRGGLFGRGRKKKKREGFLSELFEFGE